MDVLIELPDGVVIRDGRPFGETGQADGGYHDWPLPQTVAGAVRTALGHAQSPGYFDNASNAETILRIAVTRQRFVRETDGTWQALWPVPGDLLFTRSAPGESLDATTPVYRSLRLGEGTDAPFPDWLAPCYESRRKPDRNAPFLLGHRTMVHYLSGNALGDDITGIERPIASESVHVTIAPDSGASMPGHLYKTTVNTMVARDWGTSRPGKIGICASIMLEDRSLELPRTIFLGGERVTAFTSPGTASFPDAPVFDDTRWLRLFLATPGCFGGWVPDWLRPAGGSWRQVPGTEVRLRLRSASIQRHQNVSGWDYRRKRPKATRRLVRAGSIYLVELETPGQTAGAVGALWGQSLCMNESGRLTQEGRDGFGLCLVGTADGHVEETTDMEPVKGMTA